MTLPDTLTILSWNIGYAGLGDNMDFFYDGGRRVRDSRERTARNLKEIVETISRVNPDIALLQEVDLDSRRSYRIRLPDPSVLRADYPVELDGQSCDCAYVELGRPGIPHAVVPYPGLQNADEQALFRLGRALRYHPAFPRGANVNFYELTAPNEVFCRTWERGVEDFTYACGTGSGSLAAVLTVKELCKGPSIRVRTRGGLLTVDVLRDGKLILDLLLTGPADLVCEGDTPDETEQHGHAD